MYATILDGTPTLLVDTGTMLQFGEIAVSYESLASMTDEERADLGVVATVDDEVPAGKIVTGSTLDLVDGQVIQHWTLADAPAPLVTIAKADIFRRATDEEAAAMDGALSAQTARVRRIYEGASFIRSDDELFTLLQQALTSLFGESRAADLLAPST